MKKRSLVSCASLTLVGHSALDCCTAPDEGVRRLTATDCSLLGQTCAVASNGEAMCTAPGEEPIVVDDGGFDECGGGVSGGSTGGSSGDDAGAGGGIPSDLRDMIERIRTHGQSTYVGPLKGQ